MPGDQQPAQRLAVVGDPLGDRRVRLHHRHAVLGQGAQQRVLAQDVPVGRLLHGEHRPLDLDEADEVDGRAVDEDEPVGIDEFFATLGQV